jgi:hypothetical protein
MPAAIRFIARDFREKHMTTANGLHSETTKRLGVLLVFLGVLFSLDTLLGISFVYKLWPVVILILGIGLIGIYGKRNARESLYLIVGEYLILFSILAMYCNFTAWRALGRLWPWFIAFLGIALIIHFFLHARQRMILFLGVLLFGLAVFFYSVFSIGGQYWWLIFIVVGLSILISGLAQ